MVVYVVGFQPANENASVGGFDWWPATEAGRRLAIGSMVRHLADGDDHSLTFVPLEVPDGMDRDETTRWIEGRLELVEVGRR